jgi:pyroglutamyl-peptidase
MSDSGTVLLTGFEAFGNSPINPTAGIIDRLDGTGVLGRRVVGMELPVSVGRVGSLLRAAVDAHTPEVVLSLGLANGRSMLALERVAVNVLDFPLADNEGVQPVDQPVIAGAPTAYLTTMPIKSILMAWADRGLPGYVSNSAGTYVCNATFFQSLHLAATRGHRAGLVHVPYLPEQAAALTRPGASGPGITHLPTSGLPSLGFEVMVSAVHTAIEVALSTRTDAVVTAGAVS